jgi:hypothetical protein
MQVRSGSHAWLPVRSDRWIACAIGEREPPVRAAKEKLEDIDIHHFQIPGLEIGDAACGADQPPISKLEFHPCRGPYARRCGVQRYEVEGQIERPLHYTVACLVGSLMRDRVGDFLSANRNRLVGGGYTPTLSLQSGGFPHALP